MTLKDADGSFIWVDRCPLASDVAVAEQLAWTVDEAEAVLPRDAPELADCQVDVLLGIAIGAQLGVVLDSIAIGRLAALSVDIVLDLYGWD